MPKNRVIYVGLLLIAASALIWLGALLARFILDSGILPWTGGLGVLLVIVGMVLEARKQKETAALSAGSADPVTVNTESRTTSV